MLTLTPLAKNGTLTCLYVYINSGCSVFVFCLLFFFFTASCFLGLAPCWAPPPSSFLHFFSVPAHLLCFENQAHLVNINSSPHKLISSTHILTYCCLFCMVCQFVCLCMCTYIYIYIKSTFFSMITPLLQFLFIIVL